MKDINILIFDFGNVLIDIDIEGALRGLKDLMGMDQSFDLTRGKPSFFRSFEIGEISETLFINAAVKAAKRTLYANDFVHAWNAMLLGIPKHRLDMLDALRSTYQIWLLSNTNEMHINWVRQYMDNTYGIRNFEQRFFDKVYYSYEMGMRKPDDELFDFMVKELGKNGHRALFFDDTEINVMAANKAGLLATYHDPKDEISDHLKRLELL